MKRLKKICIIFGIPFLPIVAIALYLLNMLWNQMFNLAIIHHDLIWLVTLISAAVIGLWNGYRYVFHRKRCFSSWKEYFFEEKYSLERAKNMYPVIPEQYLFKHPTGLVIGKYRKKYVCIDPDNKQIANHLCIIGNSSAGKSSGPILTSLIPNFMTGQKPKISFLVIDVKPELAEISTCGGGYVKILNPLDRSSWGWDMYAGLTQESDDDQISNRLEEIAEVIVEDQGENNSFFTLNARNLLVGCLFYEFKCNNRGFIEALQILLESDIDRYVGEIKADPLCPRKVKMLLSEFGNENDTSDATADVKKTLKSSTGVFTRRDCEFFLDSRINKKMASPADLESGISLFLSIPRADLQLFGVVFRLIISQSLASLSRRTDSNAGSTPVVFVLDEFCNLGGQVPNYCQNLGFIRSKKVTCVSVLQQYSQLEALYGREAARTILHMGHQLVLSCEDPELAKIYSDKAGEFLEKSVSQKTTGLLGIQTGDANVSRTSQRRIRIMDDLASLGPRYESIAFLDGSRYVRFSKTRYYENPVLNTRAKSCRAYNRPLGFEIERR